MHIKMSKSALAEALNTVQQVVVGKNVSPILQNVKIETGDGQVRFECTDLDITLVAVGNCEVIEPGATTLPVKFLSTIVGKAIAPEIEISTTPNETAKITMGTSVFRLKGMPAKDFPSSKTKTEDEANLTTIKLDVKALKEMLRKTAFAIAQDETRRNLMGVYMAFQEDGAITTVGTDGRRIAIYDCEGGDKIPAQVTIIIPKKAVDVLSKRLPKDGACTLVFGPNRIKFVCETMEITSKLIDSTFPNYRMVIPANIDMAATVTVNRADLIGVIDRIAVFVSMDTGAPNISLTFAQNNLICTSQATEVGDSRDEIPIKYEGEDITVKLNPNYLKDVLSAIDEDEIDVKLLNGLSPIVIYKAGKKDYIYCLMPLRVH